jgi:hypothetical protein
MINERAIINVLIVSATFILVPFVVFSTLTVDYAPLLLFGGLLTLVAAFFFLKDSLCVWPLLCTGFVGTLNFLPLRLGAPHIACMVLILYYITGYVAIRQSRVKLGKRMLLFPIMVVSLIVLYHNHSLAVNAVGGETEGGRPAILIYLGVLAYFCGINVKSPSISFLAKIPFWFVVMAAVSSIPFFLSTYIPSLAPFLYNFTDSVNVEAYVDTQAGAGGNVVSRLGAFGQVGGALSVYLLSYYPIGTWWRPNRWWVAGLWLFCALLAISSGYRNVLFGFLCILFVATWCHYGWKSLWLPFGALVLGALLATATINNIVPIPVNKLPIIAQRTLSFFPGNWDSEALETAKSSNEFRKNIQDVYVKEYFYKSPIFGNGFDINKEEFESLNLNIKSARGAEEAAYTQAKIFIVGKMFHTGWMSVYDIVGIVGTTAFVVLGWNEIWMARRFIFKPKMGHKSPLLPVYVWLTSNIATMMISFFAVFGDFQSTFVYLCLYGIVLSQLSDIEDSAESSVVHGIPRKPAENTPLKGALSNYRHY